MILLPCFLGRFLDRLGFLHRIATRRCLLGPFLFLWFKRLDQHLGQVQFLQRTV